MPGLWEICVPLAKQNLITNPSIELDTTGYTASGASIARSTAADRARRGLASLIVNPTTGLYDGVYYTLALTSGSPYCFSLDCWGGLGISHRIYISTPGGSTVAGPVTFTGMGY